MIYKCEKCGTEYEVTSEHFGKDFQCSCGVIFTVSAPAEPAPANPNLMTCPDCGALVSKKAPACPKCGSPFQTNAAASLPPSSDSSRPIRVDTGENVLNRNRGCADLLLYGPLIFIVIVVILAICGKGC